MGKKRKKKSKGRKKRQKRGASPSEVSPAAEAEPTAEVEPAAAAEAELTAEVEPAAEAEPATTEAEPVKAEGEPQALDAQEPPPVDAVIDLDEDLDDPLARAELVAAVAGLEATPGEAPREVSPAEVESTEVDPAEEAADLAEGPSEDEPTDESLASSADTPAVDPAPDIEGASELDTDAEYGVPADSARGDDAPLIGPDALVALSEFRREGVATLPEELILDLGDATTPEERDRLLAAALAHVEMQDAIYRVPLESGASRRWKGVIATTLFVLAMILVGLPPSFLVPEAPMPLSATERGDGIRMALLMQAEQIEAFQARAGRLPSSITEVETALPGVRFIRSSNRLYQLIAYTPDGEAVVYDSASPDPSFAATEEVWARLTGDS